MVEKTPSTSEIETAIASLHVWLPEERGISRTSLTTRSVEVHRDLEGQVRLILRRSGEPPEVERLTPAAARHLGRLLLAAAGGEG